MFALYDEVEKKYATCLSDPIFGRSSDWVDEIGPKVVGVPAARLHKTKSTMKAQLTMLLWRLNMNVEMLDNGSWQKELDDKGDTTAGHFTKMLGWSVECKRRQDAGYTAFGLTIVER